VSPGTDKELLESHFSQYGAVIDAVVMYKDGRHRGFGFVTFDDVEAMNAALAEPQVIDGRTIDVKAALAKGEAPPPQTPAYGKSNGYDAYGKSMGGYGQKGGSFPSAPPAFAQKGSPTGPPCDKVFVGGLPQSTTEEAVQAYFSQFGTLVDCVVMKDRETGRSRGFGFVQFDNTDSVEQVVAEYDNHHIDEKWVECKKAVPQTKGAGKFGGGFGGGKGPGKGPGGAGPWGRPPQQAAFGGKYGAPGGYHAGKGCKGGKGYGPPAAYGPPAVAVGPRPGPYGAYAGPRPGAPVGFRPF